MSAYLKNPAIWQESWDRQQSAFMPDRVDALRVAGFAEAGVLWRGGTDAAVAGLR